MSLPSVDRLAALADDACVAVRECCAAAGYDDELIMNMAGLATSAAGAEFLPVVQHVLLRRGDRAATLARLFAYADTVDTLVVQDLISESVTEMLLEAGVLARQQGGIRSQFQLRPLEGVWLLADDPTAGRDAVMPPGGTTRQMAMVMPRVMTEPVLDVGCGPGSLALVAARRGAPMVVGTDVNERAVIMARFNARLNSLASNADFSVGDLVEPVEGRRFSLIVSQPPYVIQPPTAEAVTYLHGGPTGEELPLRLLAALPPVMAPGGRALVLMEAVARPGEPLHARVRPLLGDWPIDLLVLAAPGPPPAVQVLAYASLEAPGGGEAYRAAAQRYLDHLEAIDASDFQHALVVLRAHPAVTDRPPRARLAATVPVRALSGADAQALDCLIDSIDLAALHDDLLAMRGVTTSPAAVWVEERPCPDHEVEPRRSVRFSWDSFGSEIPMSAERYAMSMVLDRAATVGAAEQTYAEQAGTTPAAIRTDFFAFVRESLMRGVFVEARPINPLVTSD